MALTVSEARARAGDDSPEEALEITFISDDRSLGELYRLKLELDGYWVTLAPSLAEGLDRLHDRIPDLAFIDFGRGVQSRVDALEMLRRDPALRNLPIVVLLRDGEDAARGDESQVGAKDFVVNVDHVAGEAFRAVWSGPPRTPSIE